MNSLSNEMIAGTVEKAPSMGHLLLVDDDAPFRQRLALTLERRGLIKRTTGRPRSIEMLVPLSQVPPLD